MRFVMQILYPIDRQTAALCCDENHCTCSPQVGYTGIVAAVATSSQLSYASATRRRISPNQRRRKQYALVSHDWRSDSRGRVLGELRVLEGVAHASHSTTRVLGRARISRAHVSIKRKLNTSSQIRNEWVKFTLKCKKTS